MAIPDYQTLMLPVLRTASTHEMKISDVVDLLALEFNLNDDERSELLPSGKQTTFSNRTHWAKTYLKQAGLVVPTKRGFFNISHAGKSVLSANPEKIDISYLMKFPEFVAFRSRTGGLSEGAIAPDEGKSAALIEVTTSKTPEEIMRQRHAELNATLGEEMMDQITESTPSFFERLIVQLLMAMGFGGSNAEAGKAIGKSGDDGVDGVVDQDALGLDRVYVQAKRYKLDNSVGPAAIREFSGSLELHKASKGIFVTTSSFTSSAKDTAERLGKRIVLVDGKMLTQLMIKYNVGCRVEEQLEIKRLEEDFFE